MSLSDLINTTLNKENFLSVEDYIEFSERYLVYVEDGLQAVIVSRNENNYRFFQYKEEGYFSITRPINSALMYTADDTDKVDGQFREILDNVRDIPEDDIERRSTLVRAIYTIQQCIGATLDGLPAGRSNAARKINGDLFERLIQLLVRRVGVECRTGTVKVPVEVNGKVQFSMNYQHDLLIHQGEELRAIGSVKTSSKDRIDKIFMDKFLYSKLTDTALPHIAIFLHDVQRKKTKKENQYGVSATFLPGHFKGFTIKLNPLDGVYYCDPRPNMKTEPILRDHIQTIDRFFCSDLWQLISDTK